MAFDPLGASALAALGLAATTGLRARARARRAERDYPPEGRFVTVAGRRIHAVVRGAGPDLVLIHGASGNARDFTFRLAGLLAPRYRVIVFDRPGLGHSDALEGDGGSIAAQADLLVQAARVLGAERPLVLGQSYGGAVALAWAVAHPDAVAGLVLLAAASNEWEVPLSRFYRVTSHPLLGPPATALLAAWATPGMLRAALREVFEPQKPPAGYGAHIGAELTLRRASLRVNALQRARLLEQIRDQAPRYGEISVPVEILHGTADDTVDIGLHSERLAQQVPGAALHRLVGIGHMPQHVATDAVLEAVERAARRAALR